MEDKILLTQSSDWGKVAKEIIALKEEDLKGYKSLGRGFGINIYHCLQLANKHCKNFMDRAAGFRIIKDEEHTRMFFNVTGREYISVEFYEKIVQATEHSQR